MIDQEKIAGEVTRILASPHFSASPSLARALAFCVETTLAGDQASLKETTIGLSCFGRDPGYDTKLDPIVRVTIRRMRKKLDSYYLDEGKDASVRIDFPKGSYVPRFACIDEHVLPKEAVLVSLPVTELVSPVVFPEMIADESSSNWFLWHRPFRGWEAPASLVLLAIVLSLGFGSYGRGTHHDSFLTAHTDSAPRSSSPASAEVTAFPNPSQSPSRPQERPRSQSNERLSHASANPSLVEAVSGPASELDLPQAETPTPNGQLSFQSTHPSGSEIALVTLTERAKTVPSKGARAQKTAAGDTETDSSTWTEPRI